MKAPLDLQILAGRESEQVEWKENVADCDDVVATICAFANDLMNLGGGYVVCGARETADANGFQKLERQGLSAARLKEVEGTVLSRCRERVSPPLTPLVDELPADTAERRLLVFTVPATRHAHVFRRGRDEGAYYVRVGRSTRQARNGVLLQLLAQERDRSMGSPGLRRRHAGRLRSLRADRYPEAHQALPARPQRRGLPVGRGEPEPDGALALRARAAHQHAPATQFRHVALRPQPPAFRSGRDFPLFAVWRYHP